MGGLPIELGDFLDRLSGKFRRRDIEENIGTGCLIVTICESTVGVLVS